MMTNLTVGSFSLGAGPLIAGDCLGCWLLIICLLSHRPQSLAAPRADPARPAIRELSGNAICTKSQIDHIGQSSHVVRRFLAT